ncbi:MAG: DNRLRE domain-containing protein [Akkermansiaceae bacterium]|nr:DNRLRE domain-containing protein [Akkermansiaceae bacterium]
MVKFASLLPGLLLISLIDSALAHNLDTTATSISFADDYVALMSQRAAGSDPLIQQDDEFWVLLKTTPGPGTQTGVGGYQTFYIPEGVIAMDAAYVFPDASDPRGFRAIPMKGQSPIAIGNGSISPATSTEFIGWSLPGTNGLGVKFDPVTSTGAHRGTLAGVYADTGIFYSTDPRTAFNSYGVVKPPLTGGSSPMRNNSGDTVGEWYATNIADAIPRQVLGVMSLWDSQQLRAYGRADVAPLLDSNGRGTAPWGMANVVAGPDSGYAWEFDYDAYQSTAGTTTAKLRAAIKIGPWNRIRYPGSQISSDQPGLISNVLGQAGVDASLMGIPSTAIPPDANAIRFAIGQLELGRPEFAAVKVRIIDEPAAGDCWGMNADAFGGDAGGTDGGKDHIWRYFDPTVVTLTPCTFIQKVASKALVSPGEVFHYDITFANNGTLTLPNVTITDVLPSGLNHVSAVPAPSSGSGSTYVWNLGTLDPGEMVTLRQYVRATGNGTLFNTATARSNGNVIGVAKEAVEVGVRAILNKTKSVTPGSAAPGEIVAYTLDIENIGTGSNGTPLRAREFLPSGFTYQNLVSATLNGAAISSPTVTVDSSNPAQPIFTVNQSIKPGNRLRITFNALIGASVQPGTYWNSYQIEYEGKVIPPIPEAPVEVGGARLGDTVFLDWDGDGTQDAGEGGLQGVTVTLYRDGDGNGSFETLVGTKVTNTAGSYLFTGLAAGSYQVFVPNAGSGGVPAGYLLTADPAGAPFSPSFNVSLVANQSFLTADFGYRPAGSGTIGDQVFEDLDKDGINDAGEPGIANVTVRLYVDNNHDGVIDGSDLLLATTATNGSGIYGFSGLVTTRRYLVDFDSADSDLAAYFNGLYGSGANELTSATPYVVNAGFTNITTADFGFWRALPATIGDQVFIDANQNGSFDAGELPMGGITVNLYAADGVTLIDTTTTDPLGTYLFDDVAAGTYVVRVDTNDPDIPSGYSASVLSHNPAVAAGASYLTADFPFVSVFSKVVDKASASAGELLTYRMYPYWPGPSLLTSAMVTDAIPDGTTFVSAGQGGVLSGMTGSAGVPGSHPGSPGGGTATLTAVKDTNLNSASVGTNYGSDTTLVENRGGGNTLGARQILVQFDLSSIPSGATITGSQFRMTKSDTTNPAIAYQIYPLLKSWSESEASFNLRQAAIYWGGGTTPFDSLSPSADFGSLLASATVNGAGTYTWSAPALLSQVQNWYATPANNFGLVLGCNGSGTTDTVWNSRENSGTKPQLVVDYTAPAIPSTTTSISVTPNSVFDSGAGVNVNVSMTVTASGAVSNISPTALSVIPGSNGANATLVSGPTNSPASIGAGGGSAVFTWVYKVFKGTVEDQVRFSGAANGTGATFASATSNGVVVKDPAVSASVSWNLGTNSAAANGSHSGTGGSEDTTFTTTKSTWAYEDLATRNYGADPAIVIESNSPFRAHSFVEFDLTSLPAGATITSATLRLVHSNLTNAFGDTEAGSPFTVGVRRLTRSWVEGSALNAVQAGSLTWSSAGPANWTAAGGDFATTNYGSFVGGASDAVGTVYSVNVLTLVNEWYQGTQANHGLVLVPLNNPGSGDHFFSVFSDDAANSANRPQLLVTYTPAPTPATTTAISVLPSLVTDTGSGVNVAVSMTVTATGAVSNIIPPTNLTVAGTNGAGATRLSGPTGSPASIGAGGGSATFTWVYNVTAGSAPGQVTFTGTPTGTGATFGTATSNGVIVTQPLQMVVQIDSPNPGVDFIENTAEFYNGPTFLAEDSATTGLGASIGDFVWADLDGDGSQDAGEPGIAGVTVELYGADGVTLLESQVTNPDGIYHFYNLSAGNYGVRYDTATVPSGYFGTTAGSLAVSLASGQQLSTADFGLDTLPPGTGSIGDYVWIDADNDGIQDSGELPLEDVVVTLERLINGNWTTVGTATTGSDGLYSFNGLSAASYRVSVDPLSQISSPYASGSFGLDAVMDPTFDRDGTGTPHTALVTLATNSTVVSDADFGYNWSGSIGDLVWWDHDSDGLQDELPLEGVSDARVQLYHDADNDGTLDRILGDYEILTAPISFRTCRRATTSSMSMRTASPLTAFVTPCRPRPTM